MIRCLQLGAAAKGECEAQQQFGQHAAACARVYRSLRLARPQPDEHSQSELFMSFVDMQHSCERDYGAIGCRGLTLPI